MIDVNGVAELRAITADADRLTIGADVTLSELATHPGVAKHYPVVAQAAFAIPCRDKIRNRQGKMALKQAAEQWLPREIVYRPKASFGAPLRGWV